MSNALNVGDPSAVAGAVVEKCTSTAQKVAATIRRVKEIQAIADPVVKAKETENLMLGMLIGVLDNQVIVLAALTHLMHESADRHAARVEIVRPGMHGINGGRIL